MTVREIPADEVVEMTTTLHRAFRVVGCRPMCHACRNDLPVGMMFKLATYSRQKDHSREVMLCDTCEVSDIDRLAAERREASRPQPLPPLKPKSERGLGKGCFRVGGKLVLKLD